jgi:hypothetical protein
LEELSNKRFGFLHKKVICPTILETRLCFLSISMDEMVISFKTSTILLLIESMRYQLEIFYSGHWLLGVQKKLAEQNTIFFAV